MPQLPQYIPANAAIVDPSTGLPVTWFQGYINGTFSDLRTQLAGITQAQTTANTAQTTATAAQTTASTALATANAAEAGIANLANLGVLTAAQKATTLIPDAAQLEALYSLITTRANALSIIHPALDTAHTNWLTLLNSYSPAWNDTTQDTTIYTTALPTSEQAFPVGWTASAAATSSVTGAYVQLNDPSTTQFSNYFTATTMPCSSGQSVSAGIVVKKSASHTTNWAVLRLIVNNTGGNYYQDVAFNPYTGGIVGGASTLPAGVTLGSDILDLGTEWYVRNTIINLDSTSSAFWVQIYPAICNDGDTFVAYDSTKTGNILVRGCPDVAVGDWTKLGHNEILARYNAVVLAAQALSNQISAADASTALWGSVTGPNRPADNATQNIVYYSSTAPSTPNNGDLWVDTSVSPNVTRARVSGAWQLAANLTTNTNQLTDGAGLGTTATWTGVTGTGTPETNADVTRWIVGPTQNTVFHYDYTGAALAGEFSRDFTFTLMTVSGAVTSGVTWAYTVQTGGISSFTNASGAQTMSVASGVGTLTVSSLDSSTCSILVTATVGTRLVTIPVSFSRDIGAAPVSTGSGSGPTTIASGSIGTSFSSTTYVDVSGGGVTGAMPTGKTTANVIVYANVYPSSGISGSFSIYCRVTRVISGTDTQIGGATGPIGNDWQHVQSTGDPAEFDFTIVDTGLTAGTTYTWFVEMHQGSGTRVQYPSGSVTVTA